MFIFDSVRESIVTVENLFFKDGNAKLTIKIKRYISLEYRLCIARQECATLQTYAFFCWAKRKKVGKCYQSEYNYFVFSYEYQINTKLSYKKRKKKIGWIIFT